MTETPTRLDMLCEAAAVELGKEMVRDEAQLRADYDLTYREIRRRLKADKAVNDIKSQPDNVEEKHDC